jgi:iron complex outermembrane receptor protein
VRKLMVFLLVVFCSLQLKAQSTPDAAVSGTVLDPDGKVVQNASIVMRNDSTKLVRMATTGDDGRFSVADLPAGIYTIDVTAPGFATAHRPGQQLAAGIAQNVSIQLSIEKVSEEVTVSEFLPLSTILAPSQSSLEARSAQSEISQAFIQNFTAPTADYTEVVQMAPGTFSFSPNGVGLGDSKTFFRGFADGDYTMTFDGIPFNDTNSPTHHSWAFFPAQFIGTTVFDRSPGSASTIGPTNYGGSINMLSHQLQVRQNVRATVTYGSFNTRMYDARYDSGVFGPGSKSNLLIDVHQMKSDGYQTFNFQRRNAFEAKYQYAATSKMTLTLFASMVELKSNTPNTKGPTRAQVAQFGDNYLMTNDPTTGNYYKYNFYHIPSDFDYVGLRYDLGHGWALDTKVYTYRYYNKQNYNDPTKITTTSAVDKLNSYRKYGNLLPVSQTSKYGVLRVGMWSEYAKTDRFQTPSDPRTWVDQPLPNFHEKFNTTTLQPYGEYEVHVNSKLSVTPGIKFAEYKFDLTQFADNGKTVGSLNGAPFVQHNATFNAWQPSFDARYKLRRNWSVYGQFATGNEVPPSNLFDVKNAQVAALPNPPQVHTYQFGSVYKTGRFTLDVDAYTIRFANVFSSTPDESGEPVYFLTGSARTKGVEAESSVYLGHGISAYLNGTVGSAKYTDTGLWVQNAPKNTQTVGLSYQQGNWDLGFFNKRIGPMFNDNGTINEAVSIDPFNYTNLFLNYTIKGESEFNQTKIRLSVNNLFDKHNIVGVKLAGTTTATGPNDTLTLLPARSVTLSMTFGFAPHH